MRLKPSLLFILVLLVSLTGLSATAFGQSAPKRKTDPLIDSLFAVREFSQTAISPDGKKVAWVEALKAKDGSPSSKTAIYVAMLESPATPRRITAGTVAVPSSEHDLSWSPDSSKIAFLSDAVHSGQDQLYVIAAAGGAARKLTNGKGFFTDPHWSPDGKTIAILFTGNAPRAGGPLQPMTVETGVIESKIYEQRIATVDVATGKLNQVSPADLYVYEYDWSPDGKRFVATGANGSGDNNYWIAQLYTIEATSGETKSILKPAFQMAVPRWSPDGRSIAIIGGLMSDAGATGGDIYVVPATGGDAKNVTPGMKASASWLAWQKSDRILFSEIVDGNSGFAAVDPASGKITNLWNEPKVISSGSGAFYPAFATDDKTSALIIHSYSQPPEVWAGEIGNWKQVTHLNAAQRPSWGESKSIHWTSDGMKIQGWLLYPANYNPNQRYPMVVCVHGGPASAARPGWPRTFFSIPLLSSLGYFVLFPNPRGSYGQGEEFTRGNIKDFGHGDLRDILAGVDEVVKTLPVDNDRIGITGWSYGGYMTMWTVTQTNRFKAAIAGAGIANWQSYYGENDIDQWMIPYFGASVYDDPAVYAKSAPINYIKNVKTPTLIIVGDRDGECPTPQSYEYWHALKTTGVDNQLVVYEGEGHFIYKPADQRDILNRLLGWFDKYLR